MPSAPRSRGRGRGVVEIGVWHRFFRLGVELLHEAVYRRLVVAEADEPGAVPDAPAAHVVERHLDDELRAKAAPLTILLGRAPAVGLVGARLAGLVRRHDPDQL